MLEQAWRETGCRFKAWLAALLLVAAAGGFCYWIQLSVGLGITGLSRDVSWGLYIGQFTFVLGIAVSMIAVLIPYYYHDAKEFGRITIFAQFLALATIIMSILLIMVDIGVPSRVFNMMLYPSPQSPLFWDMFVLNGYFFLNLLSSWKLLEAEYAGTTPPRWATLLVYLAIPFAIGTRLVTAFIYSGLPGRDFWLSAVTAPKFLAGAFVAGPALLILLCFALRRLANYDVGAQVIRRLSLIVAYSMAATLFLLIAELFTSFYSQVPSHMYALKYFFAGLYGSSAFVPLGWLFAILSVGGGLLLFFPATRNDEKWLSVACAAVFIAMWIDKGILFPVGGFITNPFGRVTESVPTALEAGVVIGIWALGAFLLSLLYSLVLVAKRRSEGGVRS